MKIEIKEIIENEDGSALIEVELDTEATKYLMEYALLDIITKAAIKDLKNAE